MTTNRFRVGDEVLLRFLRHKPGDLIVPVRVVHDGDDYIALYTAVGTPGKCQAMRDGTRITRGTPFEVRERLVGGFTDFTWHTNHSLMLHLPGRMSAISLFFRDPDWELVAYYGNIQAPLVRTAHGFDTADYLLDLWISPDLTWEWKDEDEWQLAREHGFIEPSLLDEVRREGERIVAEVEARSWPFSAGFETWRPGPAWAIPELPAHWAHDLEFDPTQIPVEAG